MYKITNQVNGKIYIGAHRTDNLDDGYMGSGKIIRAAIAKYGVANFTKQILHVFSVEQQMFDEEKNLISAYRPDYNIRPGGAGGFSREEAQRGAAISQNNPNFVGKGALAHKAKREQNPEWAQAIIEKQLATRRKRYGTAQPQKSSDYQVSDQTRLKISESMKGNCVGDRNSQYGSMWITDGTINRKVKAVDPIPAGWYKGRVIKRK